MGLSTLRTEKVVTYTKSKIARNETIKDRGWRFLKLIIIFKLKIINFLRPFPTECDCLS